MIDQKAKALRWLWLVLPLVFLFPVSLHSQVAERVFNTDYRIDPNKEKELFFELDNISFFKDNEYDGKVLKGYTLPGLWVQPKLTFNPTKNIRLEAGVHMLWYSGAYKFPCMAYTDISKWKGRQYQKGAHVLPFFRAQMALGSVHFVLGNLYGGSNHGLIEPLYNPELDLTADPEAGLQLLYNARHFDMDLWVNWQSFIFREDTHQEAFTMGFSGRVKLNDKASPLHYYIPIQLLGQHRGGELDTIMTNSVQTLMNGATGVGVTWSPGKRILKRVNAEVNVAGYYQQAGKLWPFNQGYGFGANASVDLKDFRVKAGYWQSDNFVSMFGIPYFGAVSTKNEGARFSAPQTLYYSVEYSRTFGKQYALGLKADVYQYFSDAMKMADGAVVKPGAEFGFSLGVFLRINPSFLIKKF